MSPPPDVLRVLSEGTFCFAAARTPQGPHLTPLVYALSDGSMWLTTSRRSVKARAWARDPSFAGLVRRGEEAVAFTGWARLYDALDPGTWLPAALRGPAIAAAAARYSARNARFFAGYALDARSVPLAWTPPGRVFVEVVPERAALLAGPRLADRWGRWRPAVASRSAFRARRAPDPLAALPPDVSGGVGRGGEGALALLGAEGTVVLPATWASGRWGLLAAVPEPAFALAAAPEEPEAALAVDRASRWRARDMVGFTARGRAAAFVPGRLSSGATSARARLRELGADVDAVLLRVQPERLTWWRGWSSGTVGTT
ncbi:MAG TPA: hypothetical protein VNO17_01010 [Actinomycetota bacterium]|nr:hypothetical protein [Actinomycetota bacterium]